MHGSLPGLAAGRFGVIMFFSACRLPSLRRTRRHCIRESNHHRGKAVRNTASKRRAVATEAIARGAEAEKRHGLKTIL